jgi:hypothetical protein
MDGNLVDSEEFPRSWRALLLLPIGSEEVGGEVGVWFFIGGGGVKSCNCGLGRT